MSRAYRVSLKGSVHRVVHVEDGVCTSLELLPILARERQSELLAAELVKRGFVRNGNLATRTEEDGVVVEIDLTTGTVSVKAEATAAIDIEKKVDINVREERLAADTAREQERVDRAVEKAAKDAEEKARVEVTERLERRLSDLRRELDTITNRVTAEALKEKARQLGEIEQLLEDPESGELTITVRL